MASSLPADIAALPFEKALAELETIVGRLEKGDVPLEESIALYARGDALMFSRAPMPWHRDAFAHDRSTMPAGYVPLRHIGLYAYRQDFLQRYPALPASPLETIEAKAMPPLETVSTPPELTTVAEALPALKTVSVPPARVVFIASVPKLVILIH